MSGMSGIRDRNLEWQPRLRYPFWAENLVLNYTQCSEKMYKGNAPNFLVSNLLKLQITNHNHKKIMQYVLLLPLERFLFISKSYGGVTSTGITEICVLFDKLTYSGNSVANKECNLIAT